MWLVSPGVDALLFVGVTLTTLGPWIATDLLGVRGFYVLAVVALANGPHLISTWTRVYLLPGERWRRPLQYWVIPALGAAFAVGCVLADGIGPSLMRTVVFYWASWHFAAQSYGVLRLYQRKHGALESRAAQLEKALIFMPALFCVARRMYTGPWDLFGVQILHPPLQAWMVNGVGAACVVVALAYLPIAPRNVRPVYLAASALGFIMPYLVIRNGTAAFAAAALWHAIQYIGIVWLYNRRRYPAGIDASAPLISRISQPGREWAYVGVIAACAAAVYVVVIGFALAAGLTVHKAGLTVWTGLTLGHYYLDGVIWKFKRYDLKPLL
jgi:hypothetical protein